MENQAPNPRRKQSCSKCNGTGIVQEPNGQCHTCWECLQEGRLDAHSKKLPDSNIKV